MKAKDLVKLSMDELKTKLVQTKEELFRLKFRHAAQQLEQTAKIRVARKDVARILTVMNEKEGSA